jgi:C_GCAxxG_C_C family probable redox protein
MLKEKLKKYYDEKYDLNCAETILYAANDEYGLEIDKTGLKTMAAFGGGMGIEGLCGAITGSLAVLGIVFVKERAHESTKIKELSKKFIGDFKEKLGTDNCRELKAQYRNDEERCWRMIETAGEILDDIIKSEK